MIQLFKPAMNVEGIARHLNPVLESGWVGLGPKVAEFEKACAEYIGVKHFIALNSCTAALHLAVKWLKINDSDLKRMASTPVTFVSTNMVLLYETIFPKFVNINPDDGNMNPESLGWELATEDIRGAIVVHLGGYPCDMDAINKICIKAAVPVIEDCAHAFGSRYSNGNRVGDTNNICCWSFAAVKNLPVGDGGAISTNDDVAADWFRRSRWMGIDKTTIDRHTSRYAWEYQVKHVGYKYHMDDVHAAIGLAQLEVLEDHNEHRRNIARRYISGIKTGHPARYHGGLETSSCHFIPFFFQDRKDVMQRLEVAGIQYGTHYVRNDKYEPFIRFTKRLPGVEYYCDRELTLPIHPTLSDEDVDKVIKVVNGS